MYETATPIAGGVAAVATLAYTGADVALTGSIGAAAVLAGLVLLRVVAVRRRRRRDAE